MMLLKGAAEFLQQIKLSANINGFIVLIAKENKEWEKKKNYQTKEDRVIVFLLFQSINF